MCTKILIADDDPVCRLVLHAALRPCRLEVLEADDGDAAWRLLQQSSGPLLAILAWTMPGQDGVVLCRRIRDLTASAGRDPEVGARHLVYAILLTGRTGRGSAVLGLEAGAHDYITKPFDQEELQARVQVGLRVLGLQQALAARVRELEDALARVQQLQGLLPMCCYCKSIRTDQDYWQQVEHYISDHADVRFSHGICPICYQKVVEPQLSAFRRGRDA